MELITERTLYIAEWEIKCFLFFFLEKPLHEICFIRIKKQVGEKRGKVGTHGNVCWKQNKNVLNLNSSILMSVSENILFIICISLFPLLALKMMTTWHVPLMVHHMPTLPVHMVSLLPLFVGVDVLLGPLFYFTIIFVLMSSLQSDIPLG